MDLGLLPLKGVFVLRGREIKLILIALGLPLLFGFALHNRVKSAEVFHPSQQPEFYELSALPESTAVRPVRVTSPTPTQATARPQASRTAAPTPTAPGQETLESLPIPQLLAADAQPFPTPVQQATALDPLQWKEWPVVPPVSDELKEVYRQGLARGNDPHAFSILGDCQSLPEVFLGVFDENPVLVSTLPEPWQETITQFQGSFNRYSPAVKDGTTEGALLWGLWNDNKEKKCQTGESPLDCELRVHRPGIVFVHVGTHWEARNRHYLEIILNKILDHGAVPILVTKADNRELDERVNENYASLAAAYGVPLWNFWLSVQDLPDRGMEPNSDMYLNPAGLEVHRMGALQVLDAVWRAVR